MKDWQTESRTSVISRKFPCLFLSGFSFFLIFFGLLTIHSFYFQTLFSSNTTSLHENLCWEVEKHLCFKIIKSTEVYFLVFIVGTLKVYIYIYKASERKTRKALFLWKEKKKKTQFQASVGEDAFFYSLFPLPELLVFVFSILHSSSCKSKFPRGPLRMLLGKQSGSNCKTGGLDGSQFCRSLHCKPSHH